MTASTIQHNTHQDKTQIDEERETGRIVVHTVGSQAGLVRLDIDLPRFGTVDEVRQKVQLALPGETSPLHPTSVVAQDGRFVISFFSSDIANAGHLPAEAVVTWETPGATRHTQHVHISSAENIHRTEGVEAVSIPGGDPTVVYPAAVGVLVLFAIFVASLFVFAMLI